ncbi:SDR family oxidoreductase (plasmid) [Rhizobium sp. CC1099]|uniref:SDR family oxidoreductase n=1 Tax=Rhizobium sp. CC1099 TaxID=3039160 RepID=UPI0024B1E298|nr:SDR family oxidoreductase [Rhizobium sp. CC1099]WFU91865.1 SDR family oxidoreductase [Rhizobium sp. CC1099]
MSNTSKVAIVTGASGGIGGAVALRLAADGFAVAAHYAGNPKHALEVVKQIEDKGGKAFAVDADITSASAVADMFAKTKSTLGHITSVVHCAGIMPLSTIETGDVALFDKVIAINLRGSFIILGEAAKAIEKNGSIVAFSTSVVATNFPSYGAYVASKAGVESLVRVLANEVRGRNITVNAVAPGPVATPLFLDGKTQQQIDHLSKMPPLERLGQPEDISNVVSFLVGPDGAWVNGQVVRANGGFA